MANLQETIGGVNVLRLDELALDFVKDYLEKSGAYVKTISLYGQDFKILEYIIGKMRDYFKENAKSARSDDVRYKAKNVSVFFGEEGYSINVGGFIN